MNSICWCWLHRWIFRGAAPSQKWKKASQRNLNFWGRGGEVCQMRAQNYLKIGSPPPHKWQEKSTHGWLANPNWATLYVIDTNSTYKEDWKISSLLENQKFELIEIWVLHLSTTYHKTTTVVFKTSISNSRRKCLIFSFKWACSLLELQEQSCKCMFHWKNLQIYSNTRIRTPLLPQ